MQSAAPLFRTGFELGADVLVLADPPPSVSYVTAGDRVLQHGLERRPLQGSARVAYRGRGGGVGLGRSCFSLETLELDLPEPTGAVQRTHRHPDDADRDSPNGTRAGLALPGRSVTNDHRGLLGPTLPTYQFGMQLIKRSITRAVLAKISSR